MMRSIETSRLRIRPFQLEDAVEQHRIVYGDPEVMRYLGDGKTRTVEQSQRAMQFFIDHDQREGFSIWSVEDKTSHQLIGHCGLFHIPQTPAVEIAYGFGKDFWGKGYATEAARACLRYGFETANLDEIIGLTYPENTASQNVLRKIGMVYQGLQDRFYNLTMTLYTLKGTDYTPDDAPYSLTE
jgi:[ribosomal protein S5]-alanine N-acetyltransferase